MTRIDESLLTRARALPAWLRERNADAVLIGGMAVHLWSLEIADDSFAEPGTLIGLARHVRATRDIDLLPTSDESAAALRAAIHGKPMELFDEPGFRKHVRPCSVGGVPIASRASLVVLKARAFARRSEERDLVDIARLVLQSALGEDSLYEEARSLLDGCDRTTASEVRYTRARFDDLDKPGPRMFAKSVRADMTRRDWEDLEEGICERVSLAVRVALPEL